ncbi:hypothetical protein D9615_010555 [Tricholomella constricta]|uniref:Uncharacterized protein n=1 Tax=Tricholomella constricta TaxID=117010 RepID=A0A8H5H5G4_9AGAR|nr:hypothetical protein D9615_010555 [Tricholomella constricta]
MDSDSDTPGDMMRSETADPCYSRSVTAVLCDPIQIRSAPRVWDNDDDLLLLAVAHNEHNRCPPGYIRVHLLRLLTAAANDDTQALDYEFDAGNDWTAQAILKSLDGLITRVRTADNGDAAPPLRIIAPPILDPTAIHCPTCGRCRPAAPPAPPPPLLTFDSEHDENIFLRSKVQGTAFVYCNIARTSGTISCEDLLSHSPVHRS